MGDGALHNQERTLLELFDNNCESSIVVATIYARFLEISFDYCYAAQLSRRCGRVFALPRHSFHALVVLACRRGRAHHRR
jgi:hypothetical protein